MPPKRRETPTIVKAGRPLSPKATPVATVAVYQKQNGGYFEAPPVVVISRGGTLRVINATTFEVAVIPDPKLGMTPATKSIPANSVGKLIIPATAPPFNQFASSILVMNTGAGTPAFGNSDPVIIIDR